MGITDAINMGKTQVEGVKIQMEVEQKNLADIVCCELKERGFACSVRNDGHQTMMAGILPVRIERLKITPDKKLTDEQMQEFNKQKELLTKEYAEMRKAEYKREIKKFKEQEKHGKTTA